MRIAAIVRPWVIVLLAATSSCAEEPPHFGTLRYRSDALEVFASEDLQACGGTFRYTEEWLAGFYDRLGRSDPPARQRYYWGNAEDFFGAEACSTGEGCAWLERQTAYGLHVPMEHEHAHLGLGPARPPSVLEEGAAVVFGATIEGAPDSGADLADGFAQRPIDPKLYAAAGRLSRMIIDKHGIDDYLELYERLDGIEGLAATADVFGDVTGDELSPLLEAAAGDDCRPELFSYHDVACLQTPATPWSTETSWRVVVELDCAGRDVVGPTEGRIWTWRRLEVKQPVRLSFRLSGDARAGGRAIVAECGSCYADSSFGGIRFELEVNKVERQSMLPGNYWIRFDAPVGEAQQLDLRIWANG